jgi:hypothetical protein
MPNPHFNYYPPSGAVLDESEPRAYWNGRAWMLNNRVYGVPSGHRLVGRRGGPLENWYYDWGTRAWMEPDKPSAPPRALRPQPRPLPQRPQPAPMPAKQENPVDKCITKETKDRNVLEYLVKHPIAPLAGALVLIGSMLADEPSPPQIPDGLPEAIQKQWMMIYNQNQQRFARRQQIWDLVGKTLLGYSDTNAIMAALPPRKV